MFFLLLDIKAYNIVMSKKLFLSTILIVLFGTIASAQDCRSIVLPHVGYNQKILDVMPQEKIDWHCQFSKNSFYFTNNAPEGALVFNISQLKSVRDQQNLSEDFQVDLSTLSYYAYNFFDFQAQDIKATVYFRINNSKYDYLAVRPIAEAHGLADEALRNNDVKK